MDGEGIAFATDRSGGSSTPFPAWTAWRSAGAFPARRPRARISSSIWTTRPATAQRTPTPVVVFINGVGDRPGSLHPRGTERFRQILAKVKAWRLVVRRGRLRASG